MTNSDITHLTQAIMELKGQIERMSERQEEMVEDVKKIKEAVYNPDEGLYARLRELEQWKECGLKSLFLLKELERMGATKYDNLEPLMDMVQDIELPPHTEFDKEMVRDFVQKYLDLYDIMEPFESVEERDNYQLQYVGESLTDFQGLDGHGYLGVEFLSTIIELFILCEKRSDGAFMFKGLLQLVIDFCDGKRDYYQVVGYSKRV